MTTLSTNEVKRILFLSLAGLTLEEADKLESHIDALTKQVQAADALADAFSPMVDYDAPDVIPYDPIIAADRLRAYRATKPEATDPPSLDQ